QHLCETCYGKRGSYSEGSCWKAYSVQRWDSFDHVWCWVGWEFNDLDQAIAKCNEMQAALGKDSVCQQPLQGQSPAVVTVFDCLGNPPLRPWLLLSGGHPVVVWHYGLIAHRGGGKFFCGAQLGPPPKGGPATPPGNFT